MASKRDNLSILKACSSPVCLKWRNEIHAHIRRSGFESDVRVGNALVQMYCKTGSIQDARVVFDGMVDRDTISWNVMIAGLAKHGLGHEAFSLFLQMQKEEIVPDATTYVSILNGSASAGALEWVKEVHKHACNAGFESNLRVGNALVHVYGNSGSVEDARLVFDGMRQRDLISWNVMIGGLAQHGDGHEAFSLFLQMQREGYVPDATSYTSILNANAATGPLDWVREVHSDAVKAGLAFGSRVGSALLHMYSKSGCMEDARLVFERMMERDVVKWTVIIGGLTQHGLGHEAYSLFLQMQKEGFVPDATTYVSILNGSASPGDLEWVKEVHSHAVRAGLLACDLRVGSALVHMYVKLGSLHDARLAFDGLGDRDLICWNVMIGGLSKHGYGHEAFSLFLQMQKEGFVLDATTDVSLLNAGSASAGALEWVREVHWHAVTTGMVSELRVSNSLIHMYSKSGSIEDARLLFSQILNRDVISWNVMIGGLAQHGYGHGAFSSFLQMQREGFLPDETTYVSILNANASSGALEWVKEVHKHACNAGFESNLRVGYALIHMYATIGGVKDAQLVFDRMTIRNLITWTTMIGGLAQHGHGSQAFSLFLQMQREGFVPDETTYVSILSASASAGALEWVKEVHNHAIAAKLASNLRAGNALIHMFATIGCIDEATLAFDRMDHRDVITWNVMISGLGQHGRGQEALQLFQKMNGIKSNASTFVALLSVCSHAGLVHGGDFYFCVYVERLRHRTHTVALHLHGGHSGTSWSVGGSKGFDSQHASSA